MFLRLSFVFTLLYCAVWSPLLAQPHINITQALNLADRQRMLSQRLGKARVFRAMGVQSDNAQRELSASTTVFEENLRTLLGYAPNKKVRAKLEKVETLWTEYKAQLLTDTTRTGAIFVVGYSTRILSVCDDAMQELLDYHRAMPTNSNEPTASISPEFVAQSIQLVNRVRMLSQRLTLYYGAFYFDLDPTAAKLLNPIGEQIHQSLTILLASEINSTEIEDALSNALNDWNVLKEKSSQNGGIAFESKNIEPAQLYDITNRLLSKMDKIAAMYASLGR
jgi:Type IV pili methyl-accepting chemotaxis transducer N-term